MANIGWRSGPAADKEYQGELSIHFTCEPSATSRLTKLALEALENLQAGATLSPFIKTPLPQSAWPCRFLDNRVAMRIKATRCVNDP